MYCRGAAGRLYPMLVVEEEGEEGEGEGGLKRRSRHLPDCWNVNAVALIIGFCTHRL